MSIHDARGVRGESDRIRESERLAAFCHNGPGKSLDRRVHNRPMVNDGDIPSQLGCESHDRNSIWTASADNQSNGR